MKKTFLFALSLLPLLLAFATPMVLVSAQTTVESCQSAGSADAIQRCIERIQQECGALQNPAAVDNCLQQRLRANSTVPESCRSLPADRIANCIAADLARRQAAGETPATPVEDIPAQCDSANLNADNCRILWYLQLFINVLSALVGIIVVAMLVLGGIQYTTAGNDPQKVGAAKNRVRNAITALIMFIFMYSILQWLVPGGIF
jgi:hypothetical protein